MEPKKLDKIIHERVRLGVMSALSVRDDLTFNELKKMLKVTDGNLSVHTSVLVEHKLIKVKKEFHGKKPRTTFSMTKPGKKKFAEYLNELETIIKECDKKK